MGLEGTRCSNKGSLLPFSPWHKNDVKCTPASCHVNESKSNNAQGATKQPSPLFSAILAFNLCIEIPGTAKSRGCFMYISPHKPSYRNKWFIIFWGGQCAGKEKKKVVKSVFDGGTDSLATKRKGRAEQRDLHSKWCKAAGSVLMLCLLCDVFIRRSKTAALAAAGPREPVKLRFHGFPSGSTIGRQRGNGPLQPVLSSVSDVGPQSGHQTSNKQQENNNFAFRRCQSGKQKAVYKRCNIPFLSALAV